MSDIEPLLREIVARETAFFEAYGAAIHGTRDRTAREAFLRGQAASAQARGRLMAELERLGVTYGRKEDAREIEPRIVALHAAVARQIEAYREIERGAEAAGDARLAKIARDHAESHERQRGAFGSLGSETDRD